MILQLIVPLKDNIDDDVPKAKNTKMRITARMHGGYPDCFKSTPVVTGYNSI